jgi:hypothetical protein
MKNGACRMFLRGVLTNATRKVNLVDTSIVIVYMAGSGKGNLGLCLSWHRSYVSVFEVSGDDKDHPPPCKYTFES